MAIKLRQIFKLTKRKPRIDDRPVGEVSTGHIVKRIKRRPRFDDRPVGEISTGQRVWRWLTLAPLRSKLASFFRRLWKFENPSWLAVRRVVVPAKQLAWYDYLNPFYWCVWVVGFLYQWIISRPYRNLSPAVPAILMTALVGGLGVAWTVGNPEARNAYYREQLTAAVRRQDYDVAKVFASKLVAVEPSDQRTLFLQAAIEAELGNQEAADRRFWVLANEKEDPAAAAWLLENRFDINQVDQWQSSQHESFRRLMGVALQGLNGPSKVNLQLTYVGYLDALGAHIQAANMAAEVAARRPEHSLLAAGLFSRAADTPSQEKWAERAEKFYAAEVTSNPNDSNAALNLARAVMLQGREQEAAEQLIETYKLTGDTDLREAGAEVLVYWSNRLASDGPKYLKQRMSLVYEALRISPNNQIVLDATIKLLIAASKNEHGERNEITEAMLKGLDPESMHFVEGTVALLDGDLSSAKLHLELAAGQKVQLPGVLNNLAVVLHEQESPDLEAALRFSEAALDSLPNHPYLRETRGQILLKMGRYKEAIPELEFALTVPDLAPKIHESLAEAYEAISEPELAAEHGRMADQLANQVTRQN